MTDVFARALADFHRDDVQGPLRYRDGEESEEHDVAGYFEAWSPADDDSFLSDPAGPVLDLGAGAGRHALYCQRHAETTAIEPSKVLVDVLRDRGVEDARTADMFSLREHFERDAFRTAYSIGTQAGLVKSVAGLRSFLGDLAHVTSPDATAFFDGYDPSHERTRELIGFRDDPARGGAFRFVQYEYDGTLGEPWLFRLFTREELRRATVGTGWEIRDVRSPDGDWSHTYNVELAKR